MPVGLSTPGRSINQVRFGCNILQLTPLVNVCWSPKLLPESPAYLTKS